MDEVRRSSDEAAAGAARERYRRWPMADVAPDGRIQPLLANGESVRSVRRDAHVDRRQPPELGSRGGLQGDLYLTSQRLVFTGRVVLDYPLAQVDDAVLAADRLLLLMRNGNALTVEASDPRLLRVEIAAARRALRGDQAAGGATDAVAQP
jgi:hypothetical protein